MTNTKWLRSALLGGVAVSVMATGAQADELSDLKAQLEALQARVNTIESAPQANLPAGTSLLTVRKGQSQDKRLTSMGYNPRDIQVPQDRGFTISVTPTADLPAPVTEITVYGYTAGYLTWTSDGPPTNGFIVPAYRDNLNSDWNVYARARFGIRAKTDTAIGQVRAHMEFQATGVGGAAVALRHAYGEWDMTPNWTLLVGQTWLTASALNFGVSTVDTTGWAGPSATRTPMVRLTYKNGPLTWKFAVESPTRPANGAIAATATNGAIAAGPASVRAKYPNFATHILYKAAGGHELWVGAKVADYSTPAAGNATGWMVQGGANIALGSIATFTGVAMFGRGEPLRTNFQVVGRFFNNVGNPTRVFAAGAGVSFNINETTTFNAIWGYTRQFHVGNVGGSKYTHTVHANIMWRPVKQMRLGWEVMWGKSRNLNNLPATQLTNSTIRGAFGAWFFF